MNLYCETFPALAKRNTLFIHGNLASAKWWQPTIQAWRQEGSLGSGALITADWRGCGRNPDWQGEKNFSIEDLAVDFFNLIEANHFGPMHVVGHSLGGLIALQMMTMQPKLIEKAVLLDPVGAGGVVFDDSMYEAFRQMALSRDLTKAVILSTVHQSEKLPSAFSEEIADDAFKAVKGIGTSVLEILKTVNIKEAATSVRTPTLILHGEKDGIIPMKDSEELVTLLPNADLQKVSEAGHCWNIEDPWKFTSTIRAFL